MSSDLTTSPSPAAIAPPRRWGRVRASTQRLGGHVLLLRRAPATVVFALALWAVGAATGSLLNGPSTVVRDHWGASVPALSTGRVWTLLTSALWSNNLAGYLGATVIVLILGSTLERRWGTGRLLVAGAATQAVGAAVGLGLVRLAEVLEGTWSTDLASSSAVGPGPLLVGLVMAYSASAGALWRRRIRLGVLVALLILVLYGGLLEDVLRLSTALAGLLVGLVLAHRSPLHPITPSSRHETRTLVAIVLAATAAGSVLAAFSPTAVGPLSVLQYLFTAPPPEPGDVAAVCGDPSAADACADLALQLRFHGIGPTVLSVLPAVLAVVLAVGLRRGRRFAWWGAIGLYALLTALGAVLAIAVLRAPQSDVAAQVLVGSRGIASVLAPLVQPVLVLVLLVVTRRRFAVVAPAGTYRRGALVAGALLGTAFVAYLLVGIIVADQFAPVPTTWELARGFPARLIPPGYLGLVEPAFLPVGSAATILFEWTGIAVWSVVIVGVLRSFLHARNLGLDTDADTARDVLAQHGDTALSYLSTWAGNSYWFTPDRRSYVAYRTHRGVCLTTGDPIGPAEEREATVRGFLDFCATHEWTPCLYSVTGQVRDVAAHLGYASVQVAEETVLPLGALAFTGKKFQDVRTAVNRAAKAGITAQWVSYPAAPLGVRDQIEEISEEWVSDKGLPEMGFTLGGVDQLDDACVRCLLAVDTEGLIHGITSWLPVHRDGHVIGWTLDFMRRRGSGFKGAMEFLIGSAALQFQTEGAEFVSLSGAPLASVDDSAARTALQRLLQVMGRTLEPIYGFRSLLAFKAKFQPTYHPLYMAYPEAAALPRIAAAISHAYLPQLTMRQGLRMLRKL